MARLPKLPLFPLGLVLYPNERLPLHIFEPRYKDLTAYCLKTGRPFGLILQEEDKMAGMGCTARIVKVLERYEDGRLDVLVRGEERFRVVQLHDGAPYATADVETVEEPEGLPERALQERVITQHMRLLELAGRTVRPSLYEDVRTLSYVIAPNAGLTLQQKQAVLELMTENERVEYLVEHLESLIPRVERKEELRRKVQSNGHFKDFPPEEQE